MASVHLACQQCGSSGHKTTSHAAVVARELARDGWSRSQHAADVCRAIRASKRS